MAGATDAAWVDVLPSLEKFTPSLKKALQGAMPKAGAEAGADYSKGFTKAAVSGVEAASSQLAAARRKEADAAGALRVAEAKLQQLRTSGRATAAQLVTAEESLAKAKRNLDGQTDAVTRSTRALAEEQKRAEKGTRGLADAQDRASRSSRGLDDNLGRTHRTGGLLVGTMSRLGGVLAAVGVTRIFGGFIADAEESAKIGRLTEAVITSTGGAAKISAQQVGDLATAISNKTAVDDEAIQSASNLLLTFTKVRNEAGAGNDIFNQATQAAIDMSVAMGTDANGAAKQLGKALNDPIKGVSALSKAGVSFTAQQKDQIKTLVESGDVLGAQKIILSEMQTQFGGAAAAAASPLQRLKVIAGNLGESVGGLLLPPINGFANLIGDRVIPGVKGLYDLLVKGDFTGEFGRAFGIAEDSGLVTFLFNVRDALRPVVDFVRDNATPILWGLSAVLGAIAAPLVLGAIGSLVGLIGGGLAAALGLLLSPVALVALAIGGIVAIFVAAYRESEPLRVAVQDLKDAFGVFFDAFDAANGAGGIQGFFDGLKAGIAAAWPLVKQAFADMGPALWSWIDENIGPVVAKLGEWLQAVASWVWNTGLPMLAAAMAQLGQALLDWIGPRVGPALAQLGEWLAALGRWLWDTGLPWLGSALADLGQALIDWIGPRIGPMLSKIGEWLGALASWLWNTGLPLLVDTLVNLGQSLIDWIAPRIPGLLGKLGEFLGTAVGWLLGTGLPMLVGALLYLAYELIKWVLPQLPGLLLNLLQFFGQVVAWIFTTGIPLLFNALWQMGSGAVKGLWESIQNSPLITKLGEIFQSAVDAVGRAWDGLKEKLATPLRAVVTFVNDKVIGNLNKVTKVFGLEIPTLNASFATGGYTGDGGKFQAKGIVHAGEFVFTKEQTAAAGVGRLTALASSLAGGGRKSSTTGSTDIGGPWDFAKGVGGKVADGVGNLVDVAGNVIGSVKDAVGSAVSWTGDKIGDLVAKGVGFALDKIIRPVGGWIADRIGNPFVRDFGKGVFSKTADAARKWGDDRDTAAVADGGGAGGATFARGGPLGSNWASLFAAVKAVIPQARLNDGVRPGANDAHGRGKAVDFGFGTGPGGAGSAGLASIARYLYTNFKSSLYELIYTGIGGKFQVKNSRDMQYNAATQAGHTNHVHAAVYHRGGVVPDTGAPDVPAWLAPNERVLTPPQDQHFQQLLARSTTAREEPARLSGLQRPVHLYTPDIPHAIRALRAEERQQEALAAAW